ncbi:MAG: hypothetical protein ABSF70_19405 [Terracidiphilus sp.]|jgi:hypothetical protein
MSVDEGELSVDELLKSAAINSKDQPLAWNKTIAIANAKMGLENNNLIRRTHELTEEQIKASNRANELTEKLLLSNEQASRDNEKNAELMNNATLQLAKSTKSLNWATWVLVGFTGVQAVIAIAQLYVSMHPSK